MSKIANQHNNYINIENERKQQQQQQQQAHQQERENILRSSEQSDQQQDPNQKHKSIENLRNQYREQDRIRNGQQQMRGDQRNKEILSKLVEDYRQLKDQSIFIQQENDNKVRELLDKLHQQDQQIHNISLENKSMHTYYKRAETLLSQQKERIQELEDNLKQLQQSQSKEKVQALNPINSQISPFKHENNEAINYINSLSNDELIELIKLKRKIDFERQMQQQDQLPMINQNQLHPQSFIKLTNRHQRSSSTFRQGQQDQKVDQLYQQQQVIKNQSKMIDKLLNHSLQNHTVLQKELVHKQPQIDFIKESSQIRQMSNSRLRNRSSYQQGNDQQIEFLQKSLESKDRLIQDIHNIRIKQDKDDALINFFNKQSSYLVDSGFDKKSAERHKI